MESMSKIAHANSRGRTPATGPGKCGDIASRWRLVVARGVLLSVCAVSITRLAAADVGDALSPSVARQSAAFRGERPVRATPDGLIIAEAEEFQIGVPGWQAQDWGENYYFASFANTFLSRKAFLGAPAQGPQTEASLTVEVPRAGRYLALVRYEATYRFETRFTLRIEQAGATRMQRLYGARTNDRIWAFGKKIQPEVAWSWGAVENVVWEGHDAFVELQAGQARLTLIADNQPEPAARRNVDLVLLTDDVEQIAMRIDKERHLPLDGLLTQVGDVFLRAVNKGADTLTLKIPPVREHSPYWTHLRHWKPLPVVLEAGQQSEWLDVGGLMDTLNDGQWIIAAAPRVKDTPIDYRVEFAVRGIDEQLVPISEFASTNPTLTLLYDANTRYTRRIRPQATVLDDILADLDAHPVPGRPPKRLIVYAYTFGQGVDADYDARVERLVKMFGLTRTQEQGRPHAVLGSQQLAGPSGYVTMTRNWEAQIEALRAEGTLDRIRTVNMGDEISLPRPPAADHDGFRTWARSNKLTPKALGAINWDGVRYTPDHAAATTNAGGYYSSCRYAQYFGIQQLRSRTETIRALLPNADTGANFSPHHGAPGMAYTGEAHKWITLFREGGLTMPWSEDYIWQLPVGSQQMNGLLLDLFRAGLRYRPEGAIHFYVMPHWPGNRPDSWRRLWYSSLAGGMKIANLFEFRPVQAAYTENYVNKLAMYREVRRAIYETAAFEDIVLDGHVAEGAAALWYSDTGDVWDVHRAPFGPNKRSLAVAVRHQQLPLDIVDEADVQRGTLNHYRLLYLADSHVSDVASRALADWVKRGGRLLATAGAGQFDQDNKPNEALRKLLGITPGVIDLPADSAVDYEKQDLPFARVFDRVTWQGDLASLPASPVVGARDRFIPVPDAKLNILATFADGSPAVVSRDVGRGQAIYAGFLVGLSYFQPAIPMRPADRSIRDDGLAHFIPTAFDAGSGALVGLPARDVARTVRASEALVQSGVIESPRGDAVILANWSGQPQPTLIVSVADTLVRKRTPVLATGGRVEELGADPDAPGRSCYRIGLDVADALLFRP